MGPPPIVSWSTFVGPANDGGRIGSAVVFGARDSGRRGEELPLEGAADRTVLEEDGVV